MKKRRQFFGGAIFLSLGAFIAKALGALYRIPLSNILGGKGLGLYQLVFPVYALLLDFSGAAVPSAISRIIAASNEEDKEQKAYNYLRSSLRLLLFFGLIGSLIMLCLSKPIATLQGEPNAYLSYICLSPAVLLVSIISCFRGYFQGLMNMLPTAISQVIEQVIKLALGLLFASLLIYNTSKAVAGATLAVTFSELIALIFLIIVFAVRKKKNNLDLTFNKSIFKQKAKKIIMTTLPITLIGIMLPFSQVIDSFLTVNILSGYRSDATVLYGLLGGAVMTVINLPVSICYGVSAAAIPAISSSKSKEEEDKNSAKALLLTVILALPCVAACLFGGDFIINLLFRNLPQSEKVIAIKLLQLASPSILLLSFLQTGNAVLIGKGRLYTPIISLMVGVIVKTLLGIVLLKIPSLNIYGSVIALNACYFTVCLINLILIFNVRVKNAKNRTYGGQLTN